VLAAQLKREFSVHGHEVSTVPEMGWASWQNGKLLTAAAQAGFRCWSRWIRIFRISYESIGSHSRQY
jgi:hypothetical protein